MKKMELSKDNGIIFGKNLWYLDIRVLTYLKLPFAFDIQ